jgi:hypothetical protein
MVFGRAETGGEVLLIGRGFEQMTAEAAREAFMQEMQEIHQDVTFEFILTSESPIGVTDV